MKVDGLSSGVGSVNVPESKVDKIKEKDFQAELEKAFSEKDEEKLRDACKEFETVFINMMYKQMRATVPKWDIVPESFAKQTFESMLDEEFAANASKGQGTGLGEMLFKQLSRQMQNKYK
ncbi:rod-binding protein [Petroclostridium sp. X23]|uniref:rod-binding protein n=1 Tax=Petroclostridium sp. X23 TaxID=3045146 RepID=UPI0024AE2542|nr:rod-binding protein [Petroclostridium sp. X23]WHH57596.1 rod-binding protein [Petroclostridium sp. X23]